MKVVCGSCGAKYSVADDKVAGKTVKIRCKKCSEVIVVRGDQSGFEEDEATRVFDYGGEAAWHVVVAGEQQGPFSPLQIGSMLMDGKIDAEAYVWKEGFDGWKALRDVPDLAALTSSKSEPQQVEAEMESDGADLFGTAAKPAPAGSDLFSGGASKGASAFSAGDDDGLVTSKPASSPRVDANSASMTGQRNENSVLFSLSNLQALATGGPSPSPSSGSPLGGGPAPRPAAKPAGHAAGEASGLIDIRALASATSTVAANKPASSSASADDLLAIGTGPSPLAGGFGAPLIAPVVPPKKEEAPPPSKAPMVIGGVLIVALVGAVGFLAYKVLNQAPQQTVVERVIVQQGGGDSNNGSGSNDPTTGTPTTAAPTTGSESTTGRTTGSTTGRTTGSTSNTGSTASTGSTTGRTTGSAATTGTPASSTTSTSTANAMRDLLANMAATGSTTTTPAMEEAAPMAASNLPATPSRADVGSALGGVRGQVSACGSGGVANVAVTFRSSGSVSSASVGGDFAGTPVASCISRAVRSARVPPFSNPSFSVTYPYRL